MFSFALFCFIAAPAVRAQWMTQSIPLNPGWNTVYFYIQPEPRALGSIITSPNVEAVYRWQRPAAATQYDVDPGDPFPKAADMQTWFPPGSEKQYLSTFGDLLANEAYYIFVNSNAPPFTLNLKGTPVANDYAWSGDAYNLYGLPVPTNASRTFTDFFAPAPEIPTTYGFGSQIYEISPLGIEYRVFQPNLQSIVRGRAYWMLASEVSRYAGPVSVEVDGGWLNFGARPAARRLAVRNDSATSRHIVIRHVASEPAPPTHAAPVAGPVPLRYGVMSWDPRNLGTQYEPMPAVMTNTLAPGGQVELSIRPDPSSLSNPAPGAVYQSVLQISDLDEQNRTFVNQFIGLRFEAIPQVVGDPTGLWAGEVTVSGVNRAQIGGFATNWNTTTILPVNRPFRFRVILEVDSNRVARLLQQAFVAWLPTEIGSTPGLDGSFVAGTNVVLYTAAQAEAFAAAHPDARVSRISSINFPFLDPLTLSGVFGETNSGSFFLSYSNSVNPFVHAFSPDHDNREIVNSQVLPLGAGFESYDLTRAVTFAYSPTNITGFASPDWGFTEWGGTYAESVGGLLSTGALIRAEGTFLIRKISGPF